MGRAYQVVSVCRYRKSSAVTPSRISRSVMPSSARLASEVCRRTTRVSPLSRIDRGPQTHHRQPADFEHLGLVLPFIGDQHGEDPPVGGDRQAGAEGRLERASVERNVVGAYRRVETQPSQSRAKGGGAKPVGRRCLGPVVQALGAETASCPCRRVT